MALHQSFTSPTLTVWPNAELFLWFGQIVSAHRTCAVRLQPQTQALCMERVPTRRDLRHVVWLPVCETYRTAICVIGEELSLHLESRYPVENVRRCAPCHRLQEPALPMRQVEAPETYNDTVASAVPDNSYLHATSYGIGQQSLSPDQSAGEAQKGRRPI